MEEDCDYCQGTGIGNPHTDSLCPVCKGRGYLLHKRDEDDREPDDDPYYDDPADDFAYDPPGMRDPD